MSSTINPQLDGRGELTAAISNALVGVLHRYTGRGPTRARTTIGENIVVCVLGATLTKGEQSLVAAGRHEVVLHGRRAFQDTMQVDAIAAVQDLTNRHVVAFMSNNHIDPDLAVEVFILEPDSGDGAGADWAGNHDGHSAGARDGRNLGLGGRRPPT